MNVEEDERRAIKKRLLAAPPPSASSEEAGDCVWVRDGVRRKRYLVSIGEKDSEGRGGDSRTGKELQSKKIKEAGGEVHEGKHRGVLHPFIPSSQSLSHARCWI